ncbi:GNAT family N-acetyltransferase [Frankia canadensis]|nr:GNAT family N-acetyltransferase [Frankia canadensis]
MPSLEAAEITAGRLHLRPWRPYDADAVHRLCQDPQIQRWTRLPSPYEHAHAEDFATRQAPLSWVQGTGAPFAVVDATTEELLASVELMHITAQGEAEIGYWCAAHCRGQGVASQAVAAVCRWGFGTLGLSRIEWRAAVGNVASLRVARKTGFVLEGTLRQALVVGGGRRVDCWVGSRLPADPTPPGRPPHRSG